MKSRNQTGSAHVVIIIVLVVAVLGLLGFVFWQNFIKSSTTDQGTNQTQEASVTQKTVTESLDGYTLTYEHPSNWEKTEQGIVSPNGKVTVFIGLINPEGLGGTCGSDEDVTDPIAQLEWEALQGSSAAIFSSYIAKSARDNSYFYSFGLEDADNARIRTAKAGDSACKTYTAVPGFISLDSTNNTVLRGQATFSNLSTDGEAVQYGLALPDIQDEFSADYAEQAKQILLSVKIQQT